MPDPFGENQDCSFPLNALICEHAQYCLLKSRIHDREGNAWTSGSEQVNVPDNSIHKHTVNITALVSHSSLSSTPRPTWP